jgi:ribokinase
MNGHILVVGSINMDLVVRVPRHPQIGETILGGSFATFPGGKGANQAVAAARLGAEVKMIGRVGKDAFGEALLETVARDGVDTSFLFRDPDAASGVALITVDEAGRNTIVVAAGANARLTADDVVSAEAAFRGASVLVMQLEIPLPVVEKSIRLARKHDLKIILNPAPAQSLPDGLLSSVDYLIPNQNELALLAGNENSLDSSVQALQMRGATCLIVTLGEQGVLVARGSERRHIPAYKVTAVDTVAAGDAFVGAFAVAIAEGYSLLEAAEWGNAAGAVAVTRPGAQPSLPHRDELLAMLSEADQ